jgi:hypothetical protein
MGSEKGNVKIKRKMGRPQIIERMAPQAGLEPATLRLTGEKNVVSRPFAAVCRTLPDPAPSPTESGDLRPSLCAGACCSLPLFGAPKGQEKGNVLTSASAPAAPV